MLTKYNRIITRTYKFGESEWWQAMIDDETGLYAIIHRVVNRPDEHVVFATDDLLYAAMTKIAETGEWAEMYDGLVAVRLIHN